MYTYYIRCTAFLCTYVVYTDTCNPILSDPSSQQSQADRWDVPSMSEFGPKAIQRIIILYVCVFVTFAELYWVYVY